MIEITDMTRPLGSPLGVPTLRISSLLSSSKSLLLMTNKVKLESRLPTTMECWYCNESRYDRAVMVPATTPGVPYMAGKSGGIIIAGFGGICGCEEQSSHVEQGIEVDTFKMNFTKQVLSSKTGRRPLLVSKPRGDVWIPPPANYDRKEHKNNKKEDPFCSVCVDNNFNEDDAMEEEIEREVKLIHSRPSVAYRKHSPRNWTQELVLGRVKRLSFSCIKI